MKWRIWQDKILLLMRIKNHDNDALCRQAYEEGERMSWPGLAQEVSAIFEELGIADVNDVNLKLNIQSLSTITTTWWR